MRTVLEVDGLFDGRAALTDAALVVEDGEITWVGKRSRVPKTPKGQRSRTVEAAGPFVIPGMINCHAHLTLDGGADFTAEVGQHDALATVKAFKNARDAAGRGHDGPRSRCERRDGHRGRSCHRTRRRRGPAHRRGRTRHHHDRRSRRRGRPCR